MNTKTNQTTTLRDLRHPAGAKTIGDVIDILAEAYSTEADHAGLFILEQALAKATELRSLQQRFDEADEEYLRINKNAARSETLKA